MYSEYCTEYMLGKLSCTLNTVLNICLYYLYFMYLAPFYGW